MTVIEMKVLPLNNYVLDGKFQRTIAFINVSNTCS